MDRKPWERISTESSPAFSAFETYKNAGPDRSIESVAKTLAKSRTIVSRWSFTHDWVDRCRAYDEHLAAIEQAAREKVTAREAEKWAKRRLELHETEFDLAQKLIDKARQMLAFPLASMTKEGPDGTTIVKPAKWTMRDIPALLDTASKLARLSADLETERKSVNLKGSVGIKPDAEFVASILSILREHDGLPALAYLRGHGEPEPADVLAAGANGEAGRIP